MLSPSNISVDRVRRIGTTGGARLHRVTGRWLHSWHSIFYGPQRQLTTSRPGPQCCRMCCKHNSRAFDSCRLLWIICLAVMWRFKCFLTLKFRPLIGSDAILSSHVQVDTGPGPDVIGQVGEAQDSMKGLHKPIPQSPSQRSPGVSPTVKRKND